MDYGVNRNAMDGGLKQNVLILETEKIIFYFFMLYKCSGSSIYIESKKY